jgi:hypothetical protein
MLLISVIQKPIGEMYHCSSCNIVVDVSDGIFLMTIAWRFGVQRTGKGSLSSPAANNKKQNYPLISITKEISVRIF